MKTAHAQAHRADAMIWIVVADHSRARFFTAEKPTGALVEMNELLNPGARQREHDISSDRPGRLAAPDGTHHGVGDGENAREHESTLFARQVVEHLTAARTAGIMSRLYVFAEPEFLGLLRKHMDAPLRGLIEKETDKSVGSRSAKEIRELLPKLL